MGPAAQATVTKGTVLGPIPPSERYSFLRLYVEVITYAASSNSLV